MYTFIVNYKVENDNNIHIVKVKDCFTELQAVMKFRDKFCPLKFPNKEVTIDSVKKENIFNNFNDIFGDLYKKGK